MSGCRTEVFVNAGDLRTVLEMVNSTIELRFVHELEALQRMWATIEPEDKAAGLSVDGCDEVTIFDDDELWGIR
jgi:hypothetical protein